MFPFKWLYIITCDLYYKSGKLLKILTNELRVDLGWRAVQIVPMSMYIHMQMLLGKADLVMYL